MCTLIVLVVSWQVVVGSKPKKKKIGVTRLDIIPHVCAARLFDVVKQGLSICF
jgi:hypothetical protein